MFVYAYRAFEKYDLEVFGFAVLGDLSLTFRSGPYVWELAGKRRLVYQFEVAKLLDFRDRTAELEASENPFAIVILAHLYTSGPVATTTGGERSSCGSPACSFNGSSAASRSTSSSGSSTG